MRTYRPIMAVTVVAVGLAALTGCRSGSADPSTEPAPSPSATAEPTAEPTADPTAEPTSATDSPVNGPNAITAPTSGETVDGPSVAVTGEGTAFEGTLLYQVLVAGTDDPVTEGFTMAGGNGEIGPFTIDLTLDPGEYTVQVWEPDVSDGEAPDGPYRNLVAVTFTVR